MVWANARLEAECRASEALSKSIREAWRPVNAWDRSYRAVLRGDTGATGTGTALSGPRDWVPERDYWAEPSVADASRAAAEAPGRQSLSVGAMTRAVRLRRFNDAVN